MRFVVGLLFCAASLPSFSQSDPRPIQAEDKLARPILIIAPKYPVREPGDNSSVEIRVTGIVTKEGVMELPVFTPYAGNEKFIAAIQEVLALWRFRPAIDNRMCAPTSSPGTISVWFEEKNGRPSVSVSTPTTSATNDELKNGDQRLLQRKMLWRPKAEFPVKARQVGMEGAAEVLVRVNYAGDVVQSTLLYSTPHIIFGEAAIASLGRLKLSPIVGESDPQESTCYVMKFTFCFNDGPAEYPNSACSNRYSKK